MYHVTADTLRVLWIPREDCYCNDENRKHSQPIVKTEYIYNINNFERQQPLLVVCIHSNLCLYERVVTLGRWDGKLPIFLRQNQGATDTFNSDTYAALFTNRWISEGGWYRNAVLKWLNSVDFWLNSVGY